MKVIQELAAYFERRGMLTRTHIDRLLRKGFLAIEAPSTMVGLCDEVGQTYYFRIRGDDVGTVWGTDVYTADSSLSAAVLHAGVVPAGETQVVRVTVVEPLQQYVGSVQNGVSSHNFGAYGTAYRIDAL
ncbi:MAG: hypothetical protein K2R98_15295 [Gemmataceae bacterium]|nr:hypothetical protein [Gemmataceae bacterium]